MTSATRSANRDLQAAVRANDAPTVEKLLYGLPVKNRIQALVLAIECGHHECVKVLIYWVRLCASRSIGGTTNGKKAAHAHAAHTLAQKSLAQALETVERVCAFGHGHEECAKMVYGEALLQATQDNDTKRVQQLLDNPYARHASHTALLYCVHHQLDTNTATQLLQHCDARTDESAALCSSVLKKNQTYIDVLWAHSDPRAALNKLQKEYPSTPDVWTDFQARVSATELATAVANCSPVVPRPNQKCKSKM